MDKNNLFHKKYLLACQISFMHVFSVTGCVERLRYNILILLFTYIVFTQVIKTTNMSRLWLNITLGTTESWYFPLLHTHFLYLFTICQDKGKFYQG